MTAKDVDSGIASYTFEYKQSDEKIWKKAAEKVSASTSYSYTYEGLSKGEDYDFRVIVTDKAGLQSSSEVSNETTVDPTAPSKPTIVPSGTRGRNGWYTSEIRLTVVPGESAKNGIKGVIYKVEGANRINETTVDTTSYARVTITVDGESTIYAKTIDKVGKVSTDWMKLTVKKDATEPTIGRFVVESVKGQQVGAGYAISWTNGNSDSMSRNR